MATSADPTATSADQVWRNPMAASHHHAGGCRKGQLRWAKQRGGRSLELMFTQEHFSSLGHLYQKIQASSHHFFFFLNVTKLQKSIPRAHSSIWAQSGYWGGFRDKNILTNCSKGYDKPQYESRSQMQKPVHYTNYSSFRLQEKKITSMKAMGCLRSVSRVTKYLSNDNKLDSQGRGKSCSRQASAL